MSNMIYRKLKMYATGERCLVFTQAGWDPEEVGCRVANFLRVEGHPQC